jgi:hypothetical protein
MDPFHLLPHRSVAKSAVREHLHAKRIGIEAIEEDLKLELIPLPYRGWSR